MQSGGVVFIDAFTLLLSSVRSMKSNSFATVVGGSGLAFLSGTSSLSRFGWWGSSCNVRRSYTEETNGGSLLSAALFRQSF